MNKDDLHEVLENDSRIKELFLMKDIATQFYSAMCNITWKKIDERMDEEAVIDRLKGKEPISWSCTWRYAGGVVAGIRNATYNLGEDYLDYYCAGNEGVISALVRTEFKRLGWVPYDEKNVYG